jgi:hypothetical protein
MKRVWRYQPKDRKLTDYAWRAESFDITFDYDADVAADYWRTCIVGTYWLLRRSGVGRYTARHIIVQMLEGPSATVALRRGELVDA